MQIPTGGSIKGTSLEHATYGLRVLSSVRLTASQLTAAQVAIKRKIKPVKGAECFMRVFPDVPVCVKGNETRMGKGKGGFEYWACRVPVGRVVFEVGGGGIREEIARQGACFTFLSTCTRSGCLGVRSIRWSYSRLVRMTLMADGAALRLAQVKLPVPTEFITRASSPRLGSISSASLTPPPPALPVPAQLAELDAKDEGGAVDVILRREEELVKGLEGLGMADVPVQEARV